MTGASITDVDSLLGVLESGAGATDDDVGTQIAADLVGSTDRHINRLDPVDVRRIAVRTHEVHKTAVAEHDVRALTRGWKPPEDDIARMQGDGLQKVLKEATSEN